MSPSTDRRQRISEVIRSGALSSQEQLLRKLERRGIRTTQSTLSRDLAALGAYKADGVYRLPGLDGAENQAPMVELVGFDTAGDHLIVLRTPPGQASVAAIRIDQAGVTEVVGTLAGDDTIFVATRGQMEQKRAIKAILSLFRQ